ncbi:hypothetical protein [Streptomyces diastatochromogenes]|uniref:Uncharacterized protein n=1 Tax=Streptomyces diastatochromogenes TaxID=42236 RepID=A0A233SNS8_STRDA|nr:hypothetical protein [Streptomyces diastatochromogenes]OXY97285.1 hypothetical protein BEK98_10205 [Streptomyces diastatochromogenes]
MSTADVTRVKEVADLFVRFLETNTAGTPSSRSAATATPPSAPPRATASTPRPSVYCTGDRSPDIQAAHAREATLLRS